MKSISSFFKRYVFVVLLVALSLKLFSQTSGTQLDTAETNTNITDTLQKNRGSGSDLEAEISYHAEDSIRFNIDKSIIYLYGAARVSYEGMELSADFIRLDQKQKILFAAGANDKYNRYRGRPIFKQGSEPPISTDSLIFNMESKKGKTYGSFSEVEGGYISAAVSKKNPYNELSFKNGIYSTCNLPHPHFGIHISRGIVTQKQIISGPAYLEIEDIPIPAVLPFGFFPKTNKRASGFRFPTFGEDASLGFFMRNIGWYFGINDYWDAELLGSLYSKGSYDGSLLARYRKNYKYNGNLSFRYASTKSGEEGTQDFNVSKNFSLQWSHTQDQAANPGTNFSANVNIQTSGFGPTSRAAGSTNINDFTRTSVASGINYGKNFANNLFQFSASATHSQDLAAKTVSVSLPTFNLGMTTLNPFENKNRTGEPRWYEKISVGYSMNGQNSVTNIAESKFLDSAWIKSNNLIQQAIPISMSFNVLKYLQFTSSVNYNERWTFKSTDQYYDEGLGRIVKDTILGFRRNYDYGFSSGFSTKIYGMKQFKKGNLVAIRHMMTPSASFTYRPDFSRGRNGGYRSLTIPGPSGRDSIIRYSIFEGTAISPPGSGRSAGISFSLDNTVEAKVRTTGDTASAYKKINILQGLNFSGNYNFLLDSFKLSTIAFSGRTAFFKEKLGINFYGSFDPYQVNDRGNRINRYTLRDGRLPRLTSFGLSTGFSFNSTQLAKRQEALAKQQDNPNLSQQQQQDIATILRNPNAFVDFNVPWNISASYSFFYNNTGLANSITNTLNFNGDLSVTPKWKVTYTSGWDFQRNTVSTTSFSIYRDLHCWDMSFTWVPFGMYKSFSFDLRVRASMLQDLKLSRRSSYNPLTL